MSEISGNGSFFLTAALKDKLKKSESIITSQDINLKSINEMFTYTQVKKTLENRSSG